MDNIDLDIDNYELDDILNLFQLPTDFGLEELKMAKRIVRKTHPDKSKLKPEVFIFFLKAYKVVYYLYEFRNRGDQAEFNYKEIIEQTKNPENEVTINKLKNHNDFNKVFNKLFESNKMKNKFNETGYGEWFKSEEDMCNKKVSSQREMNDYILQQKEKSRALVKHQNIETIGTTSGYDLTCDRPDTYSSDIFSKLNYEDLKKAHQETLIPITERDFNEREKYKSVTHLQQSRTSQDTTPLSLSQAKQFLADKKQTGDSINTSRAFKLARQAEQANNIQKNIMQQFNQLTN